MPTKHHKAQPEAPPPAQQAAATPGVSSQRKSTKAPRKPALSPELQREVDLLEYEQLVRQAVNSGKGLPHEDQRRLQGLAKRLNGKRSATDPDFFNTAAASGAFRHPEGTPAGKYVVSFRHEIVANLLVCGYSRQRIVVFSGEQWGVGHDTVDNYIRNARHLLAKHNEQSLSLRRALVSSRLDHAYEVANEERNPDVMVKSAMATAQLYGLTAAQRVELTGADGGPVETAVLDMPEKRPGLTQAEYEARVARGEIHDEACQVQAKAPPGSGADKQAKNS